MEKEKEGMLVSRRGFLAGAGSLIGAAGLLSVADVTKPAYAEDSPADATANTTDNVSPIPAVSVPGTWTGEADVVVVGTGGAGGSAIVSALEENASVIALEKNSIWGGHMQFSLGNSFGSGKEPAEIFASETASPHSLNLRDPAFARKLAENVADTRDWLFEMLPDVGAQHIDGTGLNIPTLNMTAPADYEEPANADPTTESLWCQWFPFSARGYTLGLQKRAEKLGADVHYSTAAVALVQDGDSIVGVKAVNANGDEEYYKGTVVLCTGGFVANDAMMRHYATDHRYHCFNKVQSLPSATGDGLRMAQGVNAATCGMDDFELWQGGVMDPNYRSGPAALYSPANQLSRQAALCVNKLGKRYMDESKIAGNLFSYSAAMRTSQLDHVSYTIVDSSTIKGADVYAKMHPLACEVPTRWFDEDMKDQIERGVVVSADTIEELASKLDLDPDTLADTVSHYNDMCKAGSDTDFFKPAVYLQPVANAPFYAVKDEGASPYCSWGGLKVDTEGRVLDDDAWQPIKGLYAAGEVTAYGAEVHRVTTAGRWVGAAAAKHSKEA